MKKGIQIQIIALNLDNSIMRVGSESIPAKCLTQLVSATSSTNKLLCMFSRRGSTKWR